MSIREQTEKCLSLKMLEGIMLKRKISRSLWFTFFFSFFRFLAISKGSKQLEDSSETLKRFGKYLMSSSKGFSKKKFESGDKTLSNPCKCHRIFDKMPRRWMNRFVSDERILKAYSEVQIADKQLILLNVLPWDWQHS